MNLTVGIRFWFAFLRLRLRYAFSLFRRFDWKVRPFDIPYSVDREVRADNLLEQVIRVTGARPAGLGSNHLVVASKRFQGISYHIFAGGMTLWDRNGSCKGSFCVSLPKWYPSGDRVAALALFAAFSERALWRAANPIL